VVDVALWMLAFSIPAMALAFLVGLVRWWMYVGASLRRLVARLRHRVRPDELRAALADAFQDPSLEIVYPFGHDELVDDEGRTVRPPAPASGRCVTEVRDGTRLVAAMIHDDALRDERAFIDAATSYAVLLLDNHRLASSTLVLLRALGTSRAGKLHDAVRQRLVAVAIRLEYAADLATDDPGRARDLLRELAAEVEIALGEVGSLVRPVPASPARTR
jgi:signal transduction histidine kinase